MTKGFRSPAGTLTLSGSALKPADNDTWRSDIAFFYMHACMHSHCFHDGMGQWRRSAHVIWERHHALKTSHKHVQIRLKHKAPNFVTVSRPVQQLCHPVFKIRWDSRGKGCYRKCSVTGRVLASRTQCKLRNDQTEGPHATDSLSLECYWVDIRERHCQQQI